jgi:hypothetical protein
MHLFRGDIPDRVKKAIEKQGMLRPLPTWVYLSGAVVVPSPGFLIPELSLVTIPFQFGLIAHQFYSLARAPLARRKALKQGWVVEIPFAIENRYIAICKKKGIEPELEKLQDFAPYLFAQILPAYEREKKTDNDAIIEHCQQYISQELEKIATDMWTGAIDEEDRMSQLAIEFPLEEKEPDEGVKGPAVIDKVSFEKSDAETATRVEDEVQEYGKETVREAQAHLMQTTLPKECNLMSIGMGMKDDQYVLRIGSLAELSDTQKQEIIAEVLPVFVVFEVTGKVIAG